MSRPLCTIDSSGKNRYFIDGKRVSNQAFTQHFPNFDHERGCLPVRQRVNLLKRLAPTVMVHRDLLENNLIGGILEEVENLRRNVALFDQYKIDIERQSSSAREEVRAEFQSRMHELSVQLAEHLQLLQQKESSNMELQTTISGLRESLDLCESA